MVRLSTQHSLQSPRFCCINVVGVWLVSAGCWCESWYVKLASYLLGTRVPNFGAPPGTEMAAAVAGSRAALPGLLEGLDSTLPQD